MSAYEPIRVDYCREEGRSSSRLHCAGDWEPYPPLPSTILFHAANHAGLLISVCCGTEEEACGAILGVVEISGHGGLSHGLCCDHAKKLRDLYAASRS